MFEMKEEKTIKELKRLLKFINNQRLIYSVNYNEEENTLRYKMIYGLKDIRENIIKFTDNDLKNEEILKLIETILLRFNLLKSKTRENINEELINEYFQTITRYKMPLDIFEEIDKKVLLKRLKERKNDIIHYVDTEISTRVTLTTIENITLTALVNLIDQSITKYLLAYTFIAPFIYSYIPYKIDNIANTYKYNKLVSILEKEEYKTKPNLKLFCVVNKKVHELENLDQEYFKDEIKTLKEIMEYCFQSKKLEEPTIDLEIIKQIEEIYSRIEIKKINKKTIYFKEYVERKNNDEKNIKQYVKKQRINNE